jgi:hypothetical protein
MPVFNDADVMYGSRPYSYINRGDEAYLTVDNSRFKVKILGIFSIDHVLVAPIRNSDTYEVHANNVYAINGWTDEYMKDRMKQCGARKNYCSPTAKVLLVNRNSLKFIRFGYHSSYLNRLFLDSQVGTNSFELTEVQIKAIWDSAGPRTRQNTDVCNSLLRYAPTTWAANYDILMNLEGTTIRSRLTLTGHYSDGGAINQELLYRLIGDEFMRPKKVKSKRTDYKRSYVFCG